MKNKNIIVGVTGGIAAFKAVSVVSNLIKQGYDVEVVMTKNATQFVKPLTFESIIHKRVFVEMFDRPEFMEVKHISLAEKADAILVVPSTYNIIGKIANGIADDMLTTVISATKGEVYFALAMNSNMYENPILTDNIIYLRNQGYKFIDADYGKLACDTVGKGRMKSPEEVVEIFTEELNFSKNKILLGKKVLITAGRTEEAIDPVRYLSNKSTGKMGYSLAKAAERLGAEVILISGPTDLKEPENIKFINIKTADEMYKKVFKYFEKVDIVIMTAAVADYKIKKYSNDKIKKIEGDLILELERNPDILFEIGKLKKDQFLIGFAAESENLEENALSKFEKKNLDMIVANDTSNFGSDTNKVLIIKGKNDINSIERMTKEKLAYKILENIYLNK